MLQRLTINDPIHVLVATPGGAVGQGGIDRVMATLRDELARRTSATVDVCFMATRGLGHVALSPFYLSAFLARMILLRIRGRLDVVHINLSSFGSTYRKLQIARLCRVLGVPYVLHLHGGNYHTFWKDNHSLLSRDIRRMFEGASRVIVLGETWRRFISDRLPNSKDQIVVIPNAAAKPTLTHTGGGNTTHILFLGRIGEMKGVPQLLQALQRLRDRPNWRATLAGDGDLRAARETVTQFGIADRVEFPGWVGGGRVAELIASADILVLPSFVENLPLSIVEGMASSVAIVATPVGAVEDIVHDGETGLLVQPGDVEGLASALTRLVEDPALRRELGEAAMHLHREKLDLEPFADAIVATWQLAAHEQNKASEGALRLQ